MKRESLLILLFSSVLIASCSNNPKVSSIPAVSSVESESSTFSNEESQSQPSSTDDKHSEIIESLMSKIETLEEENKSQEDVIDSLKEELTVEKSINEEQSSIISEKDEALNEMSSLVGSLEEKVNGLESLINKQDRSYNSSGGFFEYDAQFFNVPQNAWFPIPGTKHNPINFIDLDEDYTYEASTTFGGFFDADAPGPVTSDDNRTKNTRIVSPGENLYWRHYNERNEYTNFHERSYVRIIARKGENIKGYGVIEINKRDILPSSSISREEWPLILAAKYIEDDVSLEQVSKAMDSLIYSRPLGQLYSYNSDDSVINEETGWREIDYNYLSNSAEDTSTITSDISSGGGASKTYIGKVLNLTIGSHDVEFLCYSKTGVLSAMSIRSGAHSARIYSGTPLYWGCETAFDLENDECPVDTDYISVIPTSYGVVLGYSLIKVHQLGFDNIKLEEIRSSFFPAYKGQKQAITIDDVKTELDRLIEAK
ncbi:MAG: hypothetical protein MJ241_06840 [Bacilli bacterium]|nr:hypothetical protein [Bacilli bacterium]